MKWLRYIAFTILGFVAVAVAIRLMMPTIGRLLIRSDTLAKSDMIVVLGSNRLERTFEAGTLYREGWSGRIFLLRPPDIANSGLLRQLNVRVPVLADIQKDVLAQMGVLPSAIRQSPVPIGNTEAEAEFTVRYARQAGYKRIIVVTSPYHTARAGRYFGNAAGESLVVIMRPNRYERADPSRWWRRPVERLDVLLEYIKAIHGLVPSGPL